MQRRPLRVLRFPLRRVLSLRAVSSVVRQRPAAELHRHLAELRTVERSPLNSLARSLELFAVRAWIELYSLPRAGVHGREHARAFYCGLRKIFCPDGNSIEEFAGEEGKSLPAAPGADSNRAGIHRQQIVRHKRLRHCSGGIKAAREVAPSTKISTVAL